MSGIFDVVKDFMTDAIFVAMVIGLFVRGGNMFVRAVTGKEDIF